MMYEELIKALRCGTNKADKEHNCEKCRYFSGSCLCTIAMNDAAAAIEAMQAEVKRLKDVIDELREAQTYIDHYGDKWLTSAKDVPTSAYNHGYMDGKNEAEQALESKQGEWIWDDKRCIYVCSVCGSPKVRENMDRQIIKEQAYCYSCGAKMEVQ